MSTEGLSPYRVTGGGTLRDALARTAVAGCMAKWNPVQDAVGLRADQGAPFAQFDRCQEGRPDADTPCRLVYRDL